MSCWITDGCFCPKTPCLSGVDTNMCLDAVGAPDIIVALELVASVAAESIQILRCHELDKWLVTKVI